MGFFDIGLWEILLILVIALIIWGPGKLPEIARLLGRVLHNLRKASFDLTSQLTKEIEGTEKKSSSRPEKESSHHPPRAIEKDD